jgi:hypothetical protein
MECRPFDFDEMLVLWVSGLEFGVTFTRLSEEMADRLMQLIAQLMLHRLGLR